jgi:PPOX class probable F420-dependent enzyme
MMAAVQVTPITTSGTVDRFKRSSPRPAGSSTILIDLPHMDAAEALAFARKNPHAVLATMKRDRTPQLSPVLVGVDSQDRLVVSTRESAIKTLNVRRDPRAWLCVLNDRFFGNWARLSGDVEVVSLPEAMEPLVEYYRSISGEHPDWDDYRTAMIKQRRCLIRVTPTKAGPTVFG